MTKERPRCEDCIYNSDEPCHAKIGEPIEYCFRLKEIENANLKKEAMIAAIVCLREKKKLVKKYKALINMLIDELQTSRAYHLGITGLDSDAEIARKERDGDTALIRGIDRTIKYVRKAMEE